MDRKPSKVTWRRDLWTLPLSTSVLAGAVTQAALFVSGIATARLLGPEGRGYFGLVVLAPVIVSQVITLGIPAAVAHRGRRDGLGRKTADRAVLLGLIQGVVAVAMIFFGTRMISSHLRGGTGTAASVVALAALGMVLARWGQGFWQASGRLTWLNGLRVVQPIVYALLVGSLLVMSRRSGLLEVVVAFVASHWLGGALLFFTSIVVVRGSVGRRRSEEEGVGALLSFGLRGLVGEIRPFQAFRLDHLLIGIAVSPTALGLYVVGMAIPNVMSLLAVNVAVVAFPEVAAAPTAGRRIEITWRYVGLTLGSCAALGIGLFFLLPILIPLLFGEPFAPAVAVSRVLLLASFFAAGRIVVSECARGLGVPAAGSASELAIYPWLSLALLLLLPRPTLVGFGWIVVGAYLIAFLTAGGWLWYVVRRGNTGG